MKSIRKATPAFALACLVFAARPAAAQLDTGVSAFDLAVAMGIPASAIVSATLTNLNGGGTADSNGFAVHTGKLGNDMPTEGTTFVILTSGNVADIPGSNDATNTSFDQGVQDNLGADQGGDDAVQLRITIDPPDTANSFSFDFVFLSEEFPEFVGSPFNDFFLAQSAVSPANITFDSSGGASIPVASDNIVFDKSGNVMSVNNDFFIQDENQNTGTEFDGATKLLVTCAPLPNGTDPFTLVFTVADEGDAILMSAVFLDNFTFSEQIVSAPITIDPTSGTVLGGGELTIDVFTYPNPYLPRNGPLTFEIEGTQCRSTTRITIIEIYDLSGRRVATIPGGIGRTLTWDGRTASGKPLASGMYLYVVRDNENRTGANRFTLVR